MFYIDTIAFYQMIQRDNYNLPKWKELSEEQKVRMNLQYIKFYDRMVVIAKDK